MPCHFMSHRDVTVVVSFWQGKRKAHYCRDKKKNSLAFSQRALDVCSLLRIFLGMRHISPWKKLQVYVMILIRSLNVYLQGFFLNGGASNDY